MIIEGLAAGAVIKLFCDVDKSQKIDERALKKYAKAFEKNEEARLLVEQKAALTDKRLANVAKKKRAIVQNTVPRFAEVYSQIQKVEIDSSAGGKAVVLQNQMQKLAVLDSLTVSRATALTDKELVCGWLFKGMGAMFIKDSERFLSAANSQLWQSDVVYSQSQSVGAVYDAIIARADRIAKLLMAMNALFARSINETADTIAKNGFDVRQYSDYDKGVLMTCVNIAAAMSDIINIPVVDEAGKLCAEAENLLITGEKHLAQLEQCINQ